MAGSGAARHRRPSQGARREPPDPIIKTVGTQILVFFSEILSPKADIFIIFKVEQNILAPSDRVSFSNRYDEK